ncbi:Zinc finger CCCH domain-containing protein 15 [Heterocephalus glaber]|uniref:Zinc finger CCCH domain-containing protein 15 n=1 Tax=Heterocephalus glaber TaxID=10181 RepID=G5B0Q2_HETGA|nr:Zinc finger CCCH domain-containing protein 15 [Heterocephalus glaber]
MTAEVLPKKQAQAGASKKVEQKKITGENTFGLKNKKGAKQEKFTKAVTHQVKFGQQNPHQVAQSGAEKKLKKDHEKKELPELNELFNPVIAAQKVSKSKSRPAQQVLSPRCLVPCAIQERSLLRSYLFGEAFLDR